MSNGLVRCLVLSLLCVLPFNAASAQAGVGYDEQKLQIGRGLICNTQQQAERYVTLFDGDSDQAVEKVNTEANDNNACAVADVAFVPVSAGQIQCAMGQPLTGSFRSSYSA